LVIESVEEARRSVLEQKLAGYDFIKVYNRLSREVYDAIIAAAREHDMRVVGHVPSAISLQHALASGLASIEHLVGYPAALVPDGTPPANGMLVDRILLWAEHADVRKIPGIAAATVAAGTWNCVTLLVSSMMGPVRLSFDEQRERPELRYLSSAYIDGWRPRQNVQQRIDAQRDRATKAFARVQELRVLITRALRDAGARLLLGSDTPNPFVIPGVSVHDELALLVGAGLTPYEALRAGTREAAEFLGALDEFGTVAVGRRADLLLVGDDPLKDVRNVSRRAGVMVRGRWLPANELGEMLEDVAAGAATGVHSHERET
jgi:imidazolonepropionase-like amidohydrolase